MCQRDANVGEEPSCWTVQRRKDRVGQRLNVDPRFGNDRLSQTTCRCDQPNHEEWINTNYHTPEDHQRYRQQNRQKSVDRESAVMIDQLEPAVPLFECIDTRIRFSKHIRKVQLNARESVLPSERENSVPYLQMFVDSVWIVIVGRRCCVWQNRLVFKVICCWHRCFFYRLFDFVTFENWHAHLYTGVSRWDNSLQWYRSSEISCTTVGKVDACEITRFLTFSVSVCLDGDDSLFKQSIILENLKRAKRYRLCLFHFSEDCVFFDDAFRNFTSEARAKKIMYNTQ